MEGAHRRLLVSLLLACLGGMCHGPSMFSMSGVLIHVSAMMHLVVCGIFCAAGVESSRYCRYATPNSCTGTYHYLLANPDVDRGESYTVTAVPVPTGQ